MKAKRTLAENDLICVSFNNNATELTNDFFLVLFI